MIKKKAKNSNNSRRLYNIRIALSYSQREMAEEFGVVHGAIGLWETGRRKIPGPVLKLIELYEAELGISSTEEEPSSLDSLDINWLNRTIKISGAGANIVGKVVFDGIRQIIDDKESNAIRLKTREAVAQQVVDTFGNLKGLPHKLGQLFSYMDVQAPRSVKDIYSQLQHLTPPMRASAIAEVIVEEFRMTPNQLFAEWDPAPFAAASIGQVHKAVTRSGQVVAVKVQYPGIRDVIRSDLKNATILDRLGSVMLRNHEPGNLLEELTERFMDECDYTLEAKNQMEIRAIHLSNDKIVIPEVFFDLSNGRVMTSDFIDAPRFNEFRDTATKEEKNFAAGVMWDHAFRSILRHRVFNADPHPGNYLFPKGQVAFIDYGCVKHIPQQLFKKWKAFIAAVISGDKKGVDAGINEMGIVRDPKDFDYDRFYRLMREWYKPCYTDKTFAITPDFVAAQWQEMKAWFPKNKGMRFPKELLFINQLQWGLYAVLSDLGATLNWSERFIPLLKEE